MYFDDVTSFNNDSQSTAGLETCLLLLHILLGWGCPHFGILLIVIENRYDFQHISIHCCAYCNEMSNRLILIREWLIVVPITLQNTLKFMVIVPGNFNDNQTPELTPTGFSYSRKKGKATMCLVGRHNEHVFNIYIYIWLIHSVPMCLLYAYTSYSWLNL